MRFSSILRIAMVGICAVAGSWRAEAQTVVKFASVGSFTDAGIYLADELGFFKENGIKLDIRRLPSTTTVTALATNNLDVGGIGLNPALFAAVDRGIKLRLVGDKQSAKPGFSASHLVVSKRIWKGDKDSTIRAMKGSRIALGTKGSSAYKNLLSILTNHGVKADDVTIVEMEYAQMVAALRSGAIDAGILIEPAITQVEQSGDGMSVSDLLEVRAEDGGATVLLVYSEGFSQNRDLAQKFMNAYMKGVRVYNDAFMKNKDTDKVISILSHHTGLDASLIRDMNKPNLDPNQRFSIKLIEDLQDWFIEQKFLRNRVDVMKMVDTSFAEEAVKELGEYK